MFFVYFRIDEATGSSADWAFYKRNISLSYTFELRDHRNGKL